MDFEPERDYPLGTKRPALATTPGGIPLSEVTLAAAREGLLDGGQIRATPRTPRLQAEVARAAGRRPPAESPAGAAASRAEKELRRELLVSSLPELGLVAFDGPNDPRSELVVEDGSVVRMDGRAAADLDAIPRFLAA